METATAHHVRGGFRVVPRETENETQVYAVVGPTGVALYTFADMRAATAEASALNSARNPDRGSSRLVVGDEE